MTSHFRLAIVCGFTLISFSLTGCGGNGLMEISGTVSYDGQPVKKGTITFVPPDGRGPTAAVIIADGKYSARVLPGSKRVQIEGFKVVGRRHFIQSDPSSPMMDIQEQILPERYNKKTERSCEITHTVRTYDFALEKSPMKGP